MAEQLIPKGNIVIITGQDQRRLMETEAALAGVHIMQSDASKPDELRALLQRVKAEFPTCDTLINSAGIMRNVDINQTRSLTDVTREIDINLSGPVQMVQEFLPHSKAGRTL